jgi:hypothetical protein
MLLAFRNMFFTRNRPILACALFLSLSATCSMAQVSGGTVQGIVSDPTGAVIPGAKVNITNIATGVTRTVTSDQQGLYSAPNLIPGQYRVKSSIKGFATVESKPASLNVGGQLIVNLVTHVGSTSETVQVTGAIPNIETTSSTVSGLVNGSKVRELPLNARDWTQLAALEPGVSTVKTQVALNSGKGQRGFGAQMTVSGGRPQQNNYRLDGISINDYSNGAPGSVAGVDLGVDAIDEFSVLTSNAPAEYGRSSGGVINAVTRSGTDTFHGSVYEFIRNSALDARNYFDDPTQRIPAFKRNQFGASAGGPIIKGHTFIFGDYEGLRQSLGVTQTQNVFSAQALAGNLTVDHGGPITPNPAALAFIKAFYPLPNSPSPDGTSPDIGIYRFSGQQITTENFFTAKVDHHITQQNTLTGTYVIDLADISQPDELNNKRTGFVTRRQILVLEDTDSFTPQLVNTIRFGINRNVAQIGLTFPASNPAVSDTAFGTVPGQTAADTAIPEVTEFSGGLGAISSYNYHWTSIQAYDDAFLTKGLHTIKFGVSFERLRDNSISATDPSGVFTFNTFQDSLKGDAQSFTATIPGTLTERGFRQSIFGVYATDDWHALPNLTLNLGLRYEMATVPTEVHGALSTLVNLTDAAPHLGSPLFSNPTLRNFEPRLGFSWDPFKKGKTAIRGAFGIYDVLPLPYEIQLLESFSAPFLKIGVSTALPTGQETFPTTAYPYISSSPDQLRNAYFDPNPKRNYVLQYNLNIQQQLSSSLALLVGYVGSRGLHQPYRTEDADIVLPTQMGKEYIWPNPIGSGTRVNTNAGQIAALSWIGHSYYDGFEVQLRKQMSHGLQVQGSYTLSKSIDTSSTSLVGDAFSNSISSLPFFNPRLTRGLSDFDVRNNAVINFSYELPSLKTDERIATFVGNGWQVSSIFQVSSGTPFSVNFAGDPLGLNSTDPSLDAPDVLKNDPATGASCGTLVNPGNVDHYIKTGCLSVALIPPSIPQTLCDPASPPGTCLNLRGHMQRNSLIGPGLQNLDFSLVKNTKFLSISETANVQFRAEVFNILNRANFAPPTDNNAVFDGLGTPVTGAGRIDATATPSRQVQFGLKLIW